MKENKDNRDNNQQWKKHHGNREERNRKGNVESERKEGNRDGRTMTFGEFVEGAEKLVEGITRKPVFTLADVIDRDIRHHQQYLASIDEAKRAHLIARKSEFWRGWTSGVLAGLGFGASIYVIIVLAIKFLAH